MTGSLPAGPGREPADPAAAVAAAVRQALRIPGVRVDRERFLLKQAAGLLPDDATRRRVLDQGLPAVLTEPELRALGLRRVFQLTAWSSSAAVAAALPGGPVAMTAGAGADVVQQLAFGLRLSQELAYLYGHRLSAEDHEGAPLDEAETEQLLLLFGTLLEVEGAAAAVRLTGPRREHEGKPVGYGPQAGVGLGVPEDLLRQRFAGPIVGRVLRRFAARMQSAVLRRGVVRAVPLLGALGAGGAAFSALQAQGRILNHELAEGLDYTAAKVVADVEALRGAMGAD